MRLNITRRPDPVRVRDFLVLAPPRSGSNMLATALNSHPDLVCFGDMVTGEDHEWLGGELVAGQLDGELIHSQKPIYNGDVFAPKIICLVRNVQDIQSSRQVAFKRKILHMLADGEQVMRANGVPFNNHMLREENIEQEVVDIHAAAERWGGLVVKYEDLISDDIYLNIETTDIICDFLNIRSLHLTPKTKKLPTYK